MNSETGEELGVDKSGNERGGGALAFEGGARCGDWSDWRGKETDGRGGLAKGQTSRGVRQQKPWEGVCVVIETEDTSMQEEKSAGRCDPRGAGGAVRRACT